MARRVEAAPVPPGQPGVRCSIALRDVDPPVWRRLLVPGSVRLDKLHRMFQAAMGWEDCHLHSFRVDGALHGTQFDDHPADEHDEKSVSVIAAIGNYDRFSYEYDFGDSWEHEVTVEAG
ncbi:MAG: plasmid pRiA4b ORF-3 family protein [Acidimicrobiales bacterium]